MKLFAPALLILGAILNILALFMLIPLILSISEDSRNQIAFVTAAVITSLSGIGLLLFARKTNLEFLQPRQVFLITACAWLGTSFFSAIPFLLMRHHLSLADAIFEGVSGITTTGSSVMSGLDKLPRDILLWRSILNWIGGVGIIGMAIAILPFLRVGGMRLFKTESSEWSDKAMPRARSLMAMIIYCYLGLSVICCLMFKLGGMSWFNAINHAMATVSTGGFSTSDSSFGQFSSLWLMWIAIFFMLAGAIPFVLFVRLVVHQKFMFLRDAQVRGLLAIVLLTTCFLSIPLIYHQTMSPWEAITHSCFNLVSVITTTGFASTDYQQWGNLTWIIFLFCTFIGGCSGSTSGGIKVFRLQLFGGLIKEQLVTAIHPKAIISRRYNNRIVSAEIIASSVSFMIFMFLSLLIITIILGMTGLDLITSFSGAATALMNVGPGLGDLIGPAGNFASLSDAAKYTLSFGMLLGRLEFVTLLVLFAPAFWRT